MDNFYNLATDCIKIKTHYNKIISRHNFIEEPHSKHCRIEPMFFFNVEISTIC